MFSSLKFPIIRTMPESNGKVLISQKVGNKNMLVSRVFISKSKEMLVLNRLTSQIVPNLYLYKYNLTFFMILDLLIPFNSCLLLVLWLWFYVCEVKCLIELVHRQKVFTSYKCTTAFLFHVEVIFVRYFIPNWLEIQCNMLISTNDLHVV